MIYRATVDCSFAAGRKNVGRIRRYFLLSTTSADSARKKAIEHAESTADPQRNWIDFTCMMIVRVTLPLEL